MPPYICVTHALARREETDVFCRGLSRYGFRFVCIHEQTEPQHREETLTAAALLIALTNPAAAAAETVASDIRRALGRGMPVLCVSMAENELDNRFCAAEGGAVLIPAPSMDAAERAAVDRRTVALFIHRLFVRHLARLTDCFSQIRCVDDPYGRTVSAAVLAHGGDPAACYALGQAYEQGDGVPKLEVEAARWISRAADKGILNARIHMGELYLTGRGTDRDPAAAFRLFTEAAAAGDPRGDYQRGLCYLRGLGVLKDPTRAYGCFKRAALNSYAPALYEMGRMRRDGEGVPSHHRAAKLLVYAACSPVGEGFVPMLWGRFTKKTATCVTMRQLRRSRLKAALRARAEAEGQKLSESRLDHVTARCFARCRVTAVALPEDAWLNREIQPMDTPTPARGFTVALAAMTLGRLFAEGDGNEGIHPHPTRALAWYRYALRQGSVEALYELGEAYHRGYGIPADQKRAFRLFSLAAERGDERAQFALGVCHERGIGTKADAVRAVSCYEKAARAGYAPAQNNLGGCYEQGRGVVRDLSVAVEWYTRAATAELPEAACRLGLCYERGQGVVRDALKAFRLYETAAKGGHPYATYRLGLCYDRGIPEAEETEPSVLSDEEIEGRTVSVSSVENPTPESASDYHRAAFLFEKAAKAGVADAAYALSLCYREGRGVHKDEERSLAWLAEAAEGGSITACYGLGRCYLEGHALVRDLTRAVSCFWNAATLWREKGGRAFREERPDGVLKAYGLTMTEAAGDALYMLGYCVLYGMGDRGNPAVAARYKTVTPEERVRLAAEYFEEAARADHVGALTALGDLYAYGLLRAETATAEDESLRYYMEAARVGTSREYESEFSTDSPIDALMSLANRSMQVAEAAAAEGDEGSAELARVQTWRSLAGCSELGSLDACVSMAACSYHGYGTPQNTAAALWFLNRASHTHEGRVTASLWLGDLYYTGMDREPSPEKAAEAYRHAIDIADTESECGAYTLRQRREARRRVDQRSRAEACYRLAVLRAIHFDEDEDAKEAFSYLARAILMGHTAAREDLARMYAYESLYIEATAPKGKKTRKERKTPAGVYARHRLEKRRPESATARDNRAGRSRGGWMTDYYTALWPVPNLFEYGMKSTSAPSDRPAYVSAEVTSSMLAAALNHLGDCLFYGEGLTADPAAAVACYREVVDMKIPVPRGETPPIGQTWARYSYGWCLLHGVGTPQDPREAVRCLTLAAKTHAEACYTLGECYEAGIGMDVPDGVEAFKYYRKALKLGYRKAEPKVLELEKRLRAEE